MTESVLCNARGDLGFEDVYCDLPLGHADLHRTICDGRTFFWRIEHEPAREPILASRGSVLKGSYRFEQKWVPSFSWRPHRQTVTLLTIPASLYFPSVSVNGWFTATRWTWLGFALAWKSRSATLAEIKAVHGDPDYYGHITVSVPSSSAHRTQGAAQ